MKSYASNDKGAGRYRKSSHSFKGGRPLDSTTRQRMEHAFGEDFSGVRIHTDSAGRDAAAKYNARAVTMGNHIAFDNGEYRPGTPVGDGLLAHELAHTLQQQGQGNTNAAQAKSRAETGGALEHDADRSAVGVVSRLWSGVKGIAGNIKPRLKSGLQIQSCRRAPEEETEQKDRPPEIRTEYTVRANERLKDIAERFNVSLALLIRVNRAQYPRIGTGRESFIGRGWKLRIPYPFGITAAEFQAVQRGDLSSIKEKQSEKFAAPGRLALTADQQNALAAVAMSEGPYPQRNLIIWAYINRLIFSKENYALQNATAESESVPMTAFNTALNGSNGYRNRANRNRHGNWYNANLAKIEGRAGEERGDRVADTKNLAATLPEDLSKNPIPGFMGQGAGSPIGRERATADINLDVKTGDKARWRKARLYYFLQQRGVVQTEFVRRTDPIPNSEAVTFVFDEAAVSTFFDQPNYRSLLDMTIPLYDHRTDRPATSLDPILRAIPGR